jgi:predicted O-linked N-acetylglucosamine transferase (SPINDLY family)
MHDEAATAFQQGKLDEAGRLCGLILSAAPEDFLGHYLLALTLSGQLRLGDSLVHFDRAAALQPGNPELHYNRGNALYALGRIEEALAAYDRAVMLAPGFAPAWNNRGNAMKALGRLPDAIASYDRVLRLDPLAVPVRRNRADLLLQMERFGEALAAYIAVLHQAPDMAEAWLGRGDALRAQGRIEEALACYGQAATRQPGMAQAWHRLALLEWLERGALGPAMAHLEKALALDPNLPHAEGLLLHLKLMASDWAGLGDSMARIEEGVRAGKPVAEPFAFLMVSQSPAELLACARDFCARAFPPQPPVARPPRPPRAKIRLGYVSGEFHDQATAHLAAGLYERHDRSQFEVIAFDNGPDDGSPMRRRLEAAFDRMIDIRALPGQAAAERVAAEGIDILVNLNGWFGRHRADLFARRPAPVCVNYLGFPGSMGAPYMDYLIADRIVVPEGERRFCSEQVVWLPHSYQVNDDRRKIAASPGRADCGLPQEAFVFCNFNTSYKLHPDMFGRWLRLLAALPQSVLWLLESNGLMAANLRREAASRGIAPDRLVFAPFAPSADNLARLALADLGLDGLPVGAHTGASDLLWAGVPLLTCRGAAFSGRVAASLNTAIGLPELIAESLDDYEALALALARDPPRLAGLRARLAANRATAPLFDTARTTRHLESAYRTMWERFAAGDKPQGFSVPG